MGDVKKIEENQSINNDVKNLKEKNIEDKPIIGNVRRSTSKADIAKLSVLNCSLDLKHAVLDSQVLKDAQKLHSSKSKVKEKHTQIKKVISKEESHHQKTRIKRNKHSE